MLGWQDVSVGKGTRCTNLAAEYDDLWNPHKSSRKELTSQNCPLTSMHASGPVIYINTLIIINKNLKEALNSDEKRSTILGNWEPDYRLCVSLPKLVYGFSTVPANPQEGSLVKIHTLTLTLTCGGPVHLEHLWRKGNRVEFSCPNIRPAHNVMPKEGKHRWVVRERIMNWNPPKFRTLAETVAHTFNPSTLETKASISMNLSPAWSTYWISYIVRTCLKQKRLSSAKITVTDRLWKWRAGSDGKVLGMQTWASEFHPQTPCKM